MGNDQNDQRQGKKRGEDERIGVQKVVERCKEEIRRIEMALSESHDKTSRSICELQMKGAQRALKDALVSLNLVSNHHDLKEKTEKEKMQEMVIDVDEQEEDEEDDDVMEYTGADEEVELIKGSVVDIDVDDKKDGNSGSMQKGSNNNGIGVEVINIDILEDEKEA